MNVDAVQNAWFQRLSDLNVPPEDWNAIPDDLKVALYTGRAVLWFSAKRIKGDFYEIRTVVLTKKGHQNS